MSLALGEARRALESGEAPIGCVLLDEHGTELGRGHNSMFATGNLIAHAEMNAFTAAAGRIPEGAKIVMVSTLEPCVMCTGAAMQSGVVEIVFGLAAPADAGTSRVYPPDSPSATAPRIIGGVEADDSRDLFLQWLDKHRGDTSRDSQREFIDQLMSLT